ncbi:MAG: hypothetical protein V9G12_18270 [Microthrixaceae bacterium]
MPKFSGRSDRAADRSSDGAVDRAPSWQGGALLSTVDRIVESRYDSAVALVDGIRARPGRPSTDEIVDELVRKYSKELAAVAALSGGAAALPGTGTAAAVLATGADVAFTIGKLAEMVLAIGVAYGHDARSIEERRAWVLAVLSMGKGAVSGVEGLAGRIGAEGGARIVTSITSTQLDSVNSRLAAKMLARLASEQSAGASRPSAPLRHRRRGRRRRERPDRPVGRSNRPEVLLRRTVDGADPRGRPRRDRRGGCRRLSRE